MGKYILILFVFCFSNRVKANEVAGEILLVSGKVLHVTLLVPGNPAKAEPYYLDMQNGITYIDSAGTKRVIKPKLAVSVRFVYYGNPVCMLSEIDTFSIRVYGTTKVFLKLEIDGRLKLFSYYTTVDYFGNYTVKHRIKINVIQKDNEDLLNYDYMIFQKDFIPVVSDCPDLVNKIKDKVYLKSDLAAIVTYYNSNCSAIQQMYTPDPY
jgi:hypothetical protein